ncbi:HNH endonuclease [uncultured Prevotella sp.]|uniref:HNH endonuclease n=1 Tax=uncultured Prevotella sp. TaxID=159272 RepID=UPI00265D0F23|nr:hypothetical protein [uncultured Prevotella sp.]
MIQIAITPEIEQYANDYLKDLRGLADKPEDRLTRLVNDLNRANLTIEATYVQQIINNYMDIITAKPNDYITRIASFFTNLNLSWKIRLNITQKDGTNKSVYQSVYMHIVNAMGYDDVREKIFPKYMKKLNIKSCVYCGTQYAVSVKKGKKNRSKTYLSTYTLDHYMPKSKYPYLATSFFNLYPCCAHCNQIKSDKNPIFQLYNTSNISPFKFTLDKQSFLKYSMTGDSDDLRIIFGPNLGTSQQIVDDYDNYFHINKLYKNFNDIVEEIIWKYRANNTSAIKTLKNSGFNFIPQKADINRFILGNYDKLDDILKRPLAKLVQDIAKQLGII